MLDARKITGAFSLVAIIGLVLTACSPSNATPTKDPQAVYTEAAITVAAGLTQTALAQPTSTVTPTTQPTATQTKTLAALPTSAVATTAAVIPTTASASSGDKAEWVTQNPADGTILYPNQNFTLVWTVKNVGTTTWTTAYQVRYYLGGSVLRFGASDTKFAKEVKPNDTLDITLQMKAPAEAGDYLSQWVLTNEDGSNFYPLTLSIKVGGSAPTATSEPQPTETTAPTAEIMPGP